MKQITLNKTDLTVSEICLGADGFGSKLDKNTAFSLLDKFREGGGSFIDTANVYARDWQNGYSVSERILGEYLKLNGKNSLIVATKGGHPNLKTMHTSRISRHEVQHDLDESLQSLGLDHIDFYWLHRDDTAQPIGSILEMMEEFVKEGKIRWYGGSNYSADRVQKAREYAEQKGITGFSAISNMWSPGVQSKPLSGDDTMVRFENKDLEALGDLALIPYNSTAKGWFVKASAGSSSPALDAVFDNPENRQLLKRLEADAKAKNISVQTALLEYIRAFERQIVPITSVSSLAQLNDVLAVHGNI